MDRRDIPVVIAAGAFVVSLLWATYYLWLV
jgi:hypothetical protein